MSTTEAMDKETMRLLIDGKLPDEEIQALMRRHPKDPGRFAVYLEVLQERVPWPDRILMRIGDHLYIVRSATDGRRVVKCACGYDFGDYRVNWKLGALVRVRANTEQFMEVYQPRVFAPNPDFVEIREFFCPGCVAQLAVEVPLQADPLLFEFRPDLDTFCRDWLGQPLEDEKDYEFRDLTLETLEQWAKQEGAVR